MNYKATTNTTVSRDVTKFDAETGNIYESLAVISKRANQLSVEIKEELNGKLAEFQTSSDNLEEVFENREQIEVSKHYERMPKPTLIALDEFTQDLIYFRNPAKEEPQAE